MSISFFVFSYRTYRLLRFVPHLGRISLMAKSGLRCDWGCVRIQAPPARSRSCVNRYSEWQGPPSEERSRRTSGWTQGQPVPRRPQKSISVRFGTHPMKSSNSRWPHDPTTAHEWPPPRRDLGRRRGAPPSPFFRIAALPADSEGVQACATAVGEG